MSSVSPVPADSRDSQPSEAESNSAFEALEQRSITCLLEVFAALGDSRKKKGIRFGRVPVLCLTLIALLAGKRNPSQIADFARRRLELLKRLGFEPPKRPRRKDRQGVIQCPGRITLGRLLAGVDGRQFNQLFARWMCRMLVGGERACIDGKALRGADQYVLSVFVNGLRQTVWQLDVGDKENELSALERALPEILAHYKEIKLFSGDAAFCQKPIARELAKARRDYILQLKASQPTDFALAQDSFAQITAARPPEARTVEKRGARKGRKS